MFRRRLPVRAVLAAGLALPLLLAGCPSRGGESPLDTWDLSRRYVENGDYERVWGLFTRHWQRELADRFAKQKEAVRKEREGGPNADTMRELVERQYGLGVDAYLAASPAELHARMVERTRDRILGMRPRGEPEIEGDRARLKVEFDEPGRPPSIFLFERRDGRWLIDGVEDLRR